MARPPAPPSLGEQWKQFLFAPKNFFRILALLVIIGMIADFAQHPEDFQKAFHIVVVFGVVGAGFHIMYRTFVPKKPPNKKKDH